MQIYRKVVKGVSLVSFPYQSADPWQGVVSDVDASIDLRGMKYPEVSPSLYVVVISLMSTD